MMIPTRTEHEPESACSDRGEVTPLPNSGSTCRLVKFDQTRQGVIVVNVYFDAERADA